jgi:hypothetical protein
VAAIANPLINITLQGRHDTYPKRRGMTRVPELLAAGVDVAFGHDCVMDPWYGLGSGDMLEVAHMGLHVAQMTGQEAMRQCFLAVTETPARILGLQGYGVAPAAMPTWCCWTPPIRSRRSACAPRAALVMRRGKGDRRVAARACAAELAGAAGRSNFRLEPLTPAVRAVLEYMTIELINSPGAALKDIQIRPATAPTSRPCGTISGARDRQRRHLPVAADTSREDGACVLVRFRLQTFVAILGERLLGMYRVMPTSATRRAMWPTPPSWSARRRRAWAWASCWAPLSGPRRAPGLPGDAVQLRGQHQHAAVLLWKKLGFSIVGTLPRAYRHKRLGYVDAYVMYQLLEDPLIGLTHENIGNGTLEPAHH